MSEIKREGVPNVRSKVGGGGGGEAQATCFVFVLLDLEHARIRRGTKLKPVLNWSNVCLPEHTSDTSTNYDSFLN